ncbi:MAG: helix-turn-helix domain-containing protein [Candidatus Liptonbacteria bacterium]|nr:helix-turn-helix domain-containing protein [Candidatus Liptonbacteria bacterium]
MRYTSVQESDFLGVVRKAADNHDPNLLRAFLRDILTPAEYRELITRWQIIKMLSSGVSQREIAKKLNVGIATITRGTRELSDPQGGFRQLLGRDDKRFRSRS